MPGFMGLRGLEIKNPHEMERERREEHRAPPRGDLERRSREKVQEILRDQEGDMSAYNGHIEDSRQIVCETITGAKISRIMTGRVAVLSFDDTLLTVQGIFNSVKFRHLPVVDDRGAILGIISDRDLLRMVSPFFGTVNEQTRDKEIMARKVGMIMTRNPVCVTPDITINDAVKLMNHKKISCLPIVETLDGKTLLGIVTWKDVVRAFCPACFNRTTESTRLKPGVHVNPEHSESSRLRAKTAESARLRVQTSQSGRAQARPASDTDVIPAPGKAGAAHAPDPSRFDTADMARMRNAAGSPPPENRDEPEHPSDTTVMRIKTSRDGRQDGEPQA